MEDGGTENKDGKLETKITKYIHYFSTLNI